jgi:opacity protein-like surface antigen
MRSWLILFASAPLAIAQPFTFGVKGGVPLTDFLSATSSGNLEYFTTTNRYIVGPEAELHLPFGFGVEFDALYRHLQYSNVSNAVDVLINSSTTSGAWEFPLLAKYRFPTKVVRPYVAAGVVWDTLSGLGQTITQTLIPTNVTSTSRTSSPAELQHSTVSGFVAGVGIDIHLLVLHISPEIRYTHWGSQHFLSNSAPLGTIQSNQNQAEFLVGFTFP